MRISVEGLACRRGERLLFRDLSFSLASGEALVITGRNGAGKSSLIAMLAGRLAPAAGEIRAEGIGEATLAEVTNHVGHKEGLKAALTAEENLAFAGAMLGRPRLSPREALARVGLARAADLPAGYLSAGQRRRVALARLFVSHRPLWLLDEPTSALDAASQARLAEVMQGHLAEGGLIIAATHAPLGLTGTKTLSIDAHVPSSHAPSSHVPGAAQGDEA